MKVHLVRHTSVNVPAGVCYGQTDVPLSDTFEQEAELVKEKLKNIVPDCVYTSPLERCTKLAQFCGYGNAIRDNRIKEINFGKWEMQEFEKISDPQLQLWYSDYLHVRATGGESFEDQYKRVAAFFEELKGLGKDNVLVFAHGGVLICARILSGDLTPQEAFSSLNDYGSVIEIDL